MVSTFWFLESHQILKDPLELPLYNQIFANSSKAPTAANSQEERKQAAQEPAYC